MKEKVDYKLTEEEREMQKEIDGIDQRINELIIQRKQEKDKNKQKKIDGETGWLIRHRNEMILRLYGGKEE